MPKSQDGGTEPEHKLKDTGNCFHIGSRNQTYLNRIKIIKQIKYKRIGQNRIKECRK